MGNKKNVLEVSQLLIEKEGKTILNNVSFNLAAGGQLAIIGPAGSGKSLLGMALAGKIYFKGSITYNHEGDRLSWIPQQHHFRNLSNTQDFYYQQRFNSQDAEDAMTVAQFLGDTAGRDRVFHEMRISHLLTEPLIQLSNGENKKVQIASSLLSDPSIIIMDQPFAGLDKETRAYLHALINQLAAGGRLIILITQPDEIPSCITSVLSLQKDGSSEMLSPDRVPAAQVSMPSNKIKPASTLTKPASDFEYAIRMRKVAVKYGDRIILDGIDWEVKNGERWLLSGPNGAGKSTLLSLVTGDNPQAYANDLVLFDRKRGSGETIWDIKKRIGYLSPELHLFFENGCSAFEAVASGLFDTIGLFRLLSEQDELRVHDWMKRLDVQHLAAKRLFQLSTGEQRQVLLARALVKDPDMLVLDEPCQGLDDPTQDQLLHQINECCIQGNKTLIFVTHYADKRPGCVDKVLRLDGGKVLDVG